MASKILIIGGTGYIGKFIVEAAAKSAHPTFVLVRDTHPSNQDKAKLLEGFKQSGVTLVEGDLYNHESLVKAIKEMDVVISTVGLQVADQTRIIAAIKEAGTVKRFLPSEFGLDVDRVHAVEPAKSLFAAKAKIRRAIEAEMIPYTFVSANYFAGYTLPTLAQAYGPPIDKVTIYGDGNTKAYFVNEEDTATYTIKAISDPRTLNKILYVRPPGDLYTHNELISLWENKTGRKTFERNYLSEEELLKQIQGAPYNINLILAVYYSVFIKGDSTNVQIDPSFGVEATELYPDIKYTSVDEYFNRLI